MTELFEYIQIVSP